MSWNLTGQAAVANYLDNRVQGIITESRVKYGGTVQHSITLIAGFDDGIISREAGQEVLVDADQILEVGKIHLAGA